MTKTQREVLILIGILIVIGVILIIRLGGGGNAPALPPPGTLPAGSAASPGPADDPGALLITQAPVEMLNPALSDSAIAARIMNGPIRDPFASNRRTTRPVRQTDPQPTVTRAPPERREIALTDWPEGVRYDMLSAIPGSPGEYSVLFNDQPVRVGEVIPGTRYNDEPGTEWRLVEASRLLIVIQREIHTDRIWEVSTYRHVLRPSMESDR
jgi:hypothetical protein